MSGFVLAMALVVVGQDIPKELKVNSARPIDPALHLSIKSAVEKASAAELDPKRGTGNAIEILKAALAEQTDVDLKLSLNLRIAATVLRSRFSVDTRLPADERVARALSTYSKLDLLEPGFRVWLDRAIAAAAPELKAKLGTKDARRIKLHLAMQGSGVDPAPLFATLVKQMKDLGFELVKAGPSDADVVAKLSTLEVRDEGGRAIVRTSLDLTRTSGGEPWKKSLFRTVTAPDAKIAMLSASDWLLRMGGKETLFARLEELGMTGVIMSMPGGHDHDHENEGRSPGQRAPIASPGAPPATVTPKVVLPGGGKEPTVPPKTKRDLP